MRIMVRTLRTWTPKIASMSVSPNEFTCENVGENTVTLTVTWQLELSSDGTTFAMTQWVIEGDTVRVGAEKVRVMRVQHDKNIIEVDKSISWKAGTPVSLDFNGSGPDMGAFEYD